MTDKFYELFNNKLNEFLVDISNLYPDDTDFKVAKNSVRMLQQVNVKQVQRLFSKRLSAEYRENITSRNSQFFMDNDYADILNDKEVNKDDVINNGIIVKLKGYWGAMSEENKEKVWKYFDMLVKISDKCS